LVIFVKKIFFGCLTKEICFSRIVELIFFKRLTKEQGERSENIEIEK